MRESFRTRATPTPIGHTGTVRIGTVKPRMPDPGSGSSGATLCHRVDVSVRELRNHTGKVVAAIESGQAVVLTVHGRPVADIVPRRERSERRPSDVLIADLAAISALAAELGVVSDAADFEVGATIDDITS